ncbi:glycoside hydrolase family 3 protein [Aggregatilineales bacterium SYSU G02658]
MAFRVWGLLALVLCLTPARAQDASSIVAQMTLRQKVGQMFMLSFFGSPMNESARAMLREWQPGAVVLLPSNLGPPPQVTALTNDVQQTILGAGGLPAFIAVDQEGGIIARLKDGFTEFPVPALWAATNNPALIERVGAAMAAELLAVGVNMNLAPVADLNTNPRNPIIGRRAFGSDAALVAQAVAAWVRGAQSAGVMATAKHFPGHGDTSEDSHTTLAVVPHNLERLQTVELVPFARAIQAGVGAVMMGHLYVAALEPTPNLPASLSPTIVTGLLREGMGYNGIIMTDAMDMDAIDTVYSAPERAINAILAGNDLILLGAHISPAEQISAMQAVVDAVESGRIPLERVEASARRIVAAKQRFGVLDWQPLDAASAAARIPRDAHEALVEQLFREGITLVYDRFGALPLSEGALVIYPASRPSLWNDCRPANARGLGVNLSPTDEQIAWARTEAQRASAVVVFTQNAHRDPQQIKLVQALPAARTMVVALWEVDDLAAFPEVAAYMLVYSPSVRSNRALCDILTGQITPSGVPVLEVPR